MKNIHFECAFILTYRVKLFVVALIILSLAITIKATSQVKARIPVILDTDAGSDIDDLWSLAQLLRSPELDVKLVLSSHQDTRYRARVLCNFLEASKHSDVPVGIGQYEAGGEQWQTVPILVKDYDLKKYPGTIYDDGIGRLIDIVMSSSEPVTIIAVGPATNIAEALKREPRIAEKCRYISMAGCFVKAWGSEIETETNVKNNIPALRKVLAAPWRDILFAPLDISTSLELKGINYRAIWCADDPMLRSLIQNYCVFCQSQNNKEYNCYPFTTKSTILFDCVAVYLACDESMAEIETFIFNVTDDGFTRSSPTGQFKARVALRWKNQPLFETYLTERLLGYHIR